MYVHEKIVLALAMVSTACGAADGPSRGPDVSSVSEGPALDPDQEQEFAQVRAALGEPGCGTVAADGEITLIPGGYTGGQVASPDANYGHPQCTDGFVVDIDGLEAGRNPNANSYWPVPTDWLGCLFSFTYASLWEQQGTSYRMVQESVSWGQLYANLGLSCTHQAELTTPRAGNYRVVAATRVLFGPKRPVTVSLREASPPPAP